MILNDTHIFIQARMDSSRLKRKMTMHKINSNEEFYALLNKVSKKSLERKKKDLVEKLMKISLGTTLLVNLIVK